VEGEGLVCGKGDWRGCSVVRFHRCWRWGYLVWADWLLLAWLIYGNRVGDREMIYELLDGAGEVYREDCWIGFVDIPLYFVCP
jgi:hypothetical protein